MTRRAPVLLTAALFILSLPCALRAAGNLTETGYFGIPYDKLSDAQLAKAADEALRGRTLGGAALFTRGARDAPDDPELARIAQAVHGEAARRADQAKTQSLEDSAWLKQWKNAKDAGGREFYEKYRDDRLASKQENACRYADLKGLAEQLNDTGAAYRGGSYRTFARRVAGETMSEDGVGALASPGALVKNGWKVVLHDSYVNSLLDRGVPSEVAEARWKETMDGAIRDNLSQAVVEGTIKDAKDALHADAYLALAQAGGITPEVADAALDDIRQTAVDKSMEAVDKGLALDAGTARTADELARLNAGLKAKGYDVSVGYDAATGRYTAKKSPVSLKGVKGAGAAAGADIALGLADAASTTAKLSAIAQWSDQPFIARVRDLKDRGYSGKDIASMLYSMDKKTRMAALGLDRDLRDSLASRDMADLAAQVGEVERLRQNLARATGRPAGEVKTDEVKRYLADTAYRDRMNAALAQADKSRLAALAAPRAPAGAESAKADDCVSCAPKLAPDAESAIRQGLAKGGVQDQTAQDKALANIAHGLATAQGKSPQDVTGADMLRYVTDKPYRDAMKKAYQTAKQAQADEQRLREVLAAAKIADPNEQDKAIDNIRRGLAAAQGKSPRDVTGADMLRYVTDKTYRDAMKKAYQAAKQAQAAGQGGQERKPGGQVAPQAASRAPGQPQPPEDPLCDETCQAVKAVGKIMERVEREAGPILGRVNPNAKGEPRLRDQMDKMGDPLK